MTEKDEPKTVQTIVAKATYKMVTGKFRSPSHIPNCICWYCENAAARLLSDYVRDIDEAIAKRDRAKARKLRPTYWE